MEGKGTEYWPGKNKIIKYVGTWQNSLKNGKGSLYRDDGMMHYKGCFTKDKFNGLGTLYSETGSI